MASGKIVDQTTLFQCSFKWIVDYHLFQISMNEGNIFQSSSFNPLKTDNNDSWRLKLSNSNSGHVINIFDITVERDFEKNEKKAKLLEAKINIYIITTNGLNKISIKKMPKITCEISSLDNTREVQSWLFDNIDLGHLRSKYGSEMFYKGAFLNLAFEINIKRDSVDDLNEKNLNALTSDFEKLLENQEHSDFTVIVDGKKFYLHKCILSSRCQVFGSMLEHDMQEKNQNSVELKEVKSKVMSEVFRFIYTGKVNEMEEIVTEVLTAAERYGVEDLKSLCEEVMIENITTDTVLEYLISAILNNAEKIKSSALKYISSNLKDFLQKPEFHQIGMENPDILLNIMQNNCPVSDSGTTSKSE